MDNIGGLSYFLVNNERAQFLKLFLYSQIEFDIVEGSEYVDNGIIRRKVVYESKDAVKVLYQLFDDLNIFCEYFNIPETINKEISENIINCFTGGEFLRNKNNKI